MALKDYMYVNTHLCGRAVTAVWGLIPRHCATICEFPSEGHSSEPLKGRLTVRQSRGTVSVPHGGQHGPNVRHRSTQLIRNRTVNIS
jgi:hypothetical protein